MHSFEKSGIKMQKKKYFPLKNAYGKKSSLFHQKMVSGFFLILLLLQMSLHYKT